jgi:membrane associated rhomboid family serine protease
VFSAPPLTPLVKKMIVTLLVAFVAELVLRNFVGVEVTHLLALQATNPGIHTLWQVVTYVLVAGEAPLSMLIGLLFMWLILSPFEASFGTRRTLELCTSGVLGAAGAALVVGVAFPEPPYLLLGSHPMSYAGMAAMAQVMQRGRMMFFGVFPMTSKQLLLLLVGLSVLEFLASKNHVMLAASLGSIAAGLGYVRHMSRPPRPPRKGRPSNPRLRVVRGGSDPSDQNDGPKWLN